MVVLADVIIIVLRWWGCHHHQVGGGSWCWHICHRHHCTGASGAGFIVLVLGGAIILVSQLRVDIR